MTYNAVDLTLASTHCLSWQTALRKSLRPSVLNNGQNDYLNKRRGSKFS